MIPITTENRRIILRSPAGIMTQQLMKTYLVPSGFRFVKSLKRQAEAEGSFSNIFNLNGSFHSFRAII
jgi:hypothetical protein